MKTIWKFSLGPVPTRLPTKVLLENVPLDCQFVHFGLQGEELCLWAVVDTESPLVMQSVALSGTGQPIVGGSHIGTFVVRPTWVIHAILGPRKEYGSSD
jgi:hypothetical protein